MPLPNVLVRRTHWETMRLPLPIMKKPTANGEDSANVAGELAWVYHLLGRFDDAVAMNRTALGVSPDELWIQYDLGLSLLASGKVDEAKAEYTKGMNLAAKQVADAKAAGAEPPSYLWWGLDDAADGLDDLIFALDGGDTTPAKDKIVTPKLWHPPPRSWWRKYEEPVIIRMRRCSANQQLDSSDQPLPDCRSGL